MGLFFACAEPPTADDLAPTPKQQWLSLKLETAMTSLIAIAALLACSGVRASGASR